MFEEITNSGIIEADTLHKLLNSGAAPKIKLLDATFVMPDSPENPIQNFNQERITNAQYFDVDSICDPNSDLPHMLCDTKSFIQRASIMGIENDDLIVTYGQSGMVMGPARSWWMFRIFGHKNICVLNGGLPAWKALDLPLNTEKPQPPQTRSTYKATLNQDLIIEMRDLLNKLDHKDCLIFDARPADRFEGKVKEPRAGLRSGHIPGSHNVPCALLVDPQTGKFKSAEEIKEIFQASGLGENKQIHLTCGSGVTACFLSLALYHAGITNTKIYDGSWSEWGQDTIDTPVATNT